MFGARSSGRVPILLGCWGTFGFTYRPFSRRFEAAAKSADETAPALIYWSEPL